MISAFIYPTFYLYAIMVLTFFVGERISKQSYRTITENNPNSNAVIIVSVAMALFLGYRPSTWGYKLFADSYFYAHSFALMKAHIYHVYIGSSEWVWTTFTYWCAQFMSVSNYFAIIAFGYVGFTLLACKILAPRNTIVSLMFMFGALSFYSYGTNGIRNGLACSIVLAVIALFASNKKSFPIIFVLSFLAVNIHKSTVLPLASLLASVYIVKNFKWAYTFWLLSIVLSLVLGSTLTSLFASLGFDDRLSYLTDEQTKGMFSHSGFRWDFLIYSLMPIVLGYYIVIKRGIRNNAYEILLNTYTLANAFWVMVIRGNYSNRFAYLSWFMYPIVLAYPLLKLDIWGDDQGKRVKQIMFAHVGFTWFMQTFYWG